MLHVCFTLRQQQTTNPQYAHLKQSPKCIKSTAVMRQAGHMAMAIAMVGDGAMVASVSTRPDDTLSSILPLH